MDNAGLTRLAFSFILAKTGLPRASPERAARPPPDAPRKRPRMIELSPVQQRAYDELQRIAQPGTCTTLVAGPGAGKTTILRAAHACTDGAWLGAGDLVEAGADDHPLALED